MSLEPEVTGLLVLHSDAAALVKAMDRLIENKNLRLKMGGAGRNLTEREFNIDKVVDEHFSIYNELLATTGIH